MVECNTVNAKLSSAAKNKQRTTLRVSAKIFNSDKLPH